jgi:Protein of unknown function (DUF3040)
VALSDQEQRLLEQLEQALAADDPKLANALRGTGSRKLQRRRAAFAGLGFLLGVVALVAGMETSPIVSILGFVAMLGCGVVLLTSWRQVGDAAASRPRSGSDTDKLDERWRRGLDDDN